MRMAQLSSLGRLDMNKGIIIHLDDKTKLLENYKNLFEQLSKKEDIFKSFEYITCETQKDFETLTERHHNDLKCLIFDLLGESPGKIEIDGAQAKFRECIKHSYDAYNIPIFIYSGHLDMIEGQLQNSGTTFKIDKAVSIDVIFNKIKLLHESGFLEVFCPAGLLEKQFHLDLNKAFREQFKSGDDLENIIQSIKKSPSTEDFKLRAQRIFKRIAVRSLLTELLSPEVNEQGENVDKLLSSTEHYVQRINKLDVWTGDIFRKKGIEEYIIILTPRCNIINNDNPILCCPLKLGEFPTRPESVKKALVNNPQFSGYDEYLAPSPIFKGGKILIPKFQMIDKNIIKTNYERILTLSDELTNEILGKFGAYFFRTGITPWDSNEIITIQNPKADTSVKKELGKG